LLLACPLLLGHASSVSAADPTACDQGQTPHFAFGFADLKAQIGEAVGDPLSCEYSDPNGTGDVHQRTTTGLAFWRKSTNIASFTNGAEHWAFASGGLVFWTGTSIDPVADAQVLDPTADAQPGGPASATQTSPAPAQTVPPTIVPSPQAPPPPTEADIAARVGPSVVQVITESAEGSGVRISGGIITNAHVVKDARQIQIATNDRRTATATVVRIDVNADLALLQTDLSLPALDTETASQQRQGDEILVLGYPLGLTDRGGQATLTRGLISANGIEAGTGRSLIQTDAAVNHGNSGGAMVNMRGKLIGIPTFVIRTNDAQGVNFAVGADTITAFLSQPTPSTPAAPTRATPTPAAPPPPQSPSLTPSANSGCEVDFRADYQEIWLYIPPTNSQDALREAQDLCVHALKLGDRFIDPMVDPKALGYTAICGTTVGDHGLIFAVFAPPGVSFAPVCSKPGMVRVR
jgi:S1-C subfamily serine protease